MALGVEVGLQVVVGERERVAVAVPEEDTVGLAVTVGEAVVVHVVEVEGVAVPLSVRAHPKWGEDANA